MQSNAVARIELGPCTEPHRRYRQPQDLSQVMMHDEVFASATDEVWDMHDENLDTQLSARHEGSALQVRRAS